MTAIEISYTAKEKILFGFEAIGQTIKAWHQRAKGRRELAQLSERDLKDIGLSSLMVGYEVHQPFWRPSSNLRR